MLFILFHFLLGPNAEAAFALYQIDRTNQYPSKRGKPKVNLIFYWLSERKRVAFHDLLSRLHRLSYHHGCCGGRFRGFSSKYIWGKSNIFYLTYWVGAFVWYIFFAFIIIIIMCVVIMLSMSTRVSKSERFEHCCVIKLVSRRFPCSSGFLFGAKVNKSPKGMTLCILCVRLRVCVLSICMCAFDKLEQCTRMYHGEIMIHVVCVVCTVCVWPTRWCVLNYNNVNFQSKGIEWQFDPTVI